MFPIKFLLETLTQLAIEYGFFQPASSKILDLISNKKNQNTLVMAIELAYKDFLNSEFSDLRAALLDDFFSNMN